MYLEVTSYMLTVLTFSVGFLSTRRHAHFDVLAKDLADRSWKIRQALNSGQNLGPRDLAEDVAAVAAQPDSVAGFARVVNASFLLSAAVVGGMGVTEIQDARELTLLVILFLSTGLVFALGEFDVRWMESRERHLASGTVLGQLAEVDRSLKSGDSAEGKEEMARIREAFPHWVFGRELEMALEAARPSSSRESGGAVEPMGLLTAGSQLHAAPILVAEAQLSLGEPIAALQDFQVVVPRASGSRTFERLEVVLGFAAGLPRAVFNDPELPPQWLGDNAGIELGLRSLPSVRRAAEALRDFGSAMPLEEWLSRQHGSPTWLVGEAARASTEELRRLLDQGQDSRFDGALNCLGVVCLARSLHVEALRIFEAAIRIRPNSSTSHWGKAVACQRQGWYPAAAESLASAESLDPTSQRVLDLTRMVFAGSPLDSATNQPGGPAWTSWEAVQLALLGFRVHGAPEPVGARGEVTRLVIEAALADEVAVS